MQSVTERNQLSSQRNERMFYENNGDSLVLICQCFNTTIMIFSERVKWTKQKYNAVLVKHRHVINIPTCLYAHALSCWSDTKYIYAVLHDLFFTSRLLWQGNFHRISFRLGIYSNKDRTLHLLTCRLIPLDVWCRGIISPLSYSKLQIHGV